MNDNKQKEIMKKRKKEKFHPIIEKYSIYPSHVYNTDQVGLYYKKLPNHLYIKHSQNVLYRHETNEEQMPSYNYNIDS